MNYPDNTALQVYNTAAGRLIQLPCFMDQPEPPDGFRALIFATPTLGRQNIDTYPNQSGVTFAPPYDFGALQFDLTQNLNQNQLSRCRSIGVSVLCLQGTNDGPINPFGQNWMQLVFDSGFTMPLNGATGWFDSWVYDSTNQQSVEVSQVMKNISGNTVGDFISATPRFGLLIPIDAIQCTLQCVVTVANFKLTPANFSAGSIILEG